MSGCNLAVADCVATSVDEGGVGKLHRNMVEQCEFSVPNQKTFEKSKHPKKEMGLEIAPHIYPKKKIFVQSSNTFAS